MNTIPEPGAGGKRGPNDPLVPVTHNLPPEAVRLTGASSLTIALPTSLVTPRPPRHGLDKAVVSEIAAIMRAAMLEAGIPTGPEPLPVAPEDGPDPDLPRFWWLGTPRDLAPIPARLLRAMWGRESVEVEDDLLAEVWGHDQAPSNNALKKAKGAVNKVLADSGCPRSLGIRGGRLLWLDP
jgi:hypothetical protein